VFGNRHRISEFRGYKRCTDIAVEIQGPHFDRTYLKGQRVHPADGVTGDLGQERRPETLGLGQIGYRNRYAPADRVKRRTLPQGDLRPLEALSETVASGEKLKARTGHAQHDPGPPHGEGKHTGTAQAPCPIAVAIGDLLDRCQEPCSGIGRATGIHLAAGVGKGCASTAPCVIA
jgi:hypothetical protein